MILNYRKFLREKLEKEFFISQNKYLILGENFLENAYFVFVQNCISVYNLNYYLFIVDKNKIAKFKIEVCKNQDGYIRIYKKTLFSIIGRKYYSTRQQTIEEQLKGTYPIIQFTRVEC